MKNIEKLLVLVPHQDARIQALKYSKSLYKKILKGVYPFPCVIPVASVIKPLNPDELKHTAHIFRRSIGKEKIKLVNFISASIKICGKEMVLFGQRLDPEITCDISNIGLKKIKSCFTPLISGICLIPKDNEDKTSGFTAQDKENCFSSLVKADNSISINDGLKINFWAAAVANMFWKPCAAKGEETFYKWKIGKLSWLPKK